MRRGMAFGIGIVLAGWGTAAGAASLRGPAWCGTRAHAARDAVWDHRVELARRGPRVRASSAAAVSRAGEIVIVQDEGDLALLRNPLDLQGAGLRFTPGADGFSVSRVNMALLGDAGTPLTLGDDDTRPVELPFPFPYFGSSYSSMFVNSDGNLTFGEGDNASTARSAGRLVNGPPRIAPLLADLDPTSNGTVTVATAADRVTVTWTNVPRFGETDRNTFQVSLFADGRIDFVYAAGLSALLEEGTVGIAPGGGRDGITALDLSQAAATVGKGALLESFRDADSIDTLAVASKFYGAFPDDFQQLVVYTNRHLTARTTFAYEQTVKNDAAGTGAPIFDISSEYGSRGRLESFVYMDDIAKYVEPLELPFLGADSTLAVLAHEVGHRWLATARFRDGARDSNELLGRDEVHWSFFMDSDASHDEGNDIQDLGGGRFRTVGAGLRYGPLDQYLMGLRAADEVPPFFFVRNPSGTSDTDPGRDPEVNVTFSGTRRDVTMADLQAAMGPRNPPVEQAPKEMREVFVFVAVGGPPTQAQLDKVERIRAAWPAFFNRSTEGRGTVDPSLR